MTGFSNLIPRLKQALAEDSALHDITTSAIPDIKRVRLKAKVLAKQDGVLCGVFLIPTVLKLLDHRARITLKKKDGGAIKKGNVLAEIAASATAMLGGERVMLNLLGHLSGIATLTRAYVDAVKGTAAKIYETRKTTPLWRDVEKYAVRCGGGENHRFSLSDAILVKDNHLQLLKSQGKQAYHVYGPGAPVRKTRGRAAFVEVEAATLADVWQAIKCRPDIILLDNMPLDRLKQAVFFINAARKAFNSKLPQIEVSGGVNLQSVKTLGKLGVDRISVGALTHSAAALDISLEVL